MNPDQWIEDNRERFVQRDQNCQYPVLDEKAMLRAYDAEMQAEAQRDTARLAKYVSHRYTCPVRTFGNSGTCDCGLDAAMQKSKG